jgi:polyisoprenyl-teichoic acid--peptidoglycan teichoic acid transferase
MSDTSDINVGARSDASGVDPGGSSDGSSDGTPPRRKRRRMRIMLISLGSLLALVVAGVVGILLYVNSEVGSIPRVHVGGLTPSNSSRETFLVTSQQPGNTAPSKELAALAAHPASGLIMLLHINANGTTGGAVTIPGNVSASVPGHGTQPIWDALVEGGPSLLVKTVTQLTGVPINHYARIDFNHITNLIDAVGGLEVDIPVASAAYGYNFTKGINYLNGVTAIYYARDPKISDQDRLLRQENLVRVLLAKIAGDHLLTSPVTAVHVLSSIKSMLTVDSDLSNTQVASLASKFGNKDVGSAVYVTAATQTVGGQQVLDTAIDDQLWTAVGSDSLVTFAQRYPSTVTPEAAP